MLAHDNGVPHTPHNSASTTVCLHCVLCIVSYALCGMRAVHCVLCTVRHRVESVHSAFHSPQHIFPVGYIATCSYPSLVTPGSGTRYTTTIAESGQGTALFVIVAADAPGKQWVATSAAGRQAGRLQQGKGWAVLRIVNAESTKQLFGCNSNRRTRESSGWPRQQQVGSGASREAHMGFDLL